MSVYSPNEIAALIFFSNAQFGPNLYPAATQEHGQIVQHVPPPGSPLRKKLEHWLDVAIAVCLSESGGDSDARNASSSASGLWQIMVSAHQSEINFAITAREAELSNGKTLTIFDPMVNTDVAAVVYQKAGGWTPWEAFTSGAYKKNLGHGKDAYAFLTSKKNLEAVRKEFLKRREEEANASAIAAATVTPFAGIGGILANGPGWIKDILSFVAQLGLPIGIFLLGLILIALGAWTLLRKTPVGKGVKDAVKIAAIV